MILPARILTSRRSRLLGIAVGRGITATGVAASAAADAIADATADTIAGAIADAIAGAAADAIAGATAGEE